MGSLKGTAGLPSSIPHQFISSLSSLLGASWPRLVLLRHSEHVPEHHYDPPKHKKRKAADEKLCSSCLDRVAEGRPKQPTEIPWVLSEGMPVPLKPERPQPQARNPRNPKPQTPNPKPQTLNPKLVRSLQGRARAWLHEAIKLHELLEADLTD